jgi:glycosyltransferase involved in cell wall biosynthesis
MVEGLPIIASDIEVTREVAGDAAVYAPVGDDAAFAAAIESVVRDADLRARLVAMGHVRRSELTWERTAALTAAVYRQVA